MKRIRSLLERKPRLLRFIRYGAASAVASAVSFGTIAVVFGVFGLGPAASSVVAFCAGALVAFVINRLWAWQRRNTTGIGRDFVRYWIVAIATALIALGCTTLADRYAHGAGLDKFDRTVIVEAAYFGSYAVTFVAKFLLLDRFVFGPRDRVPRSRDQVENTTRA
jgi:putative flippase GtrA